VVGVVATGAELLDDSIAKVTAVATIAAPTPATIVDDFRDCCA